MHPIRLRPLSPQHCLIEEVEREFVLDQGEPIDSQPQERQLNRWRWGTHGTSQQSSPPPDTVQFMHLKQSTVTIRKCNIVSFHFKCDRHIAFQVRKEFSHLNVSINITF